AVLHSRRMTAGYQLANCETAALVADRLGCADGVRAGLLDVFEGWDGAGGPRRPRGGGVSLGSPTLNRFRLAVFFDQLGGVDAALAALTQRSGGYLDPGLVATFGELAGETLAGAGAGDLSDRLLAAEPKPTVAVGDLDAALRAFGEAVDLKSPFLHG